MKNENEEIYNNAADDEISRLEKKLMAEHDWQLKGEVKGKERPKNSLIDAEVDFKLNKKIPLEIN